MHSAGSHQMRGARIAGLLIRQARLRRDWSQDGLCLGICTPSYLSKIEQGKAEPSPEVTELLLRRLGLVPAYFSAKITPIWCTHICALVINLFFLNIKKSCFRTDDHSHLPYNSSFFISYLQNQSVIQLFAHNKALFPEFIKLNSTPSSHYSPSQPQPPRS